MVELDKVQVNFSPNWFLNVLKFCAYEQADQETAKIMIKSDSIKGVLAWWKWMRSFLPYLIGNVTSE